MSPSWRTKSDVSIQACKSSSPSGFPFIILEAGTGLRHLRHNLALFYGVLCTVELHTDLVLLHESLELFELLQWSLATFRTHSEIPDSKESKHIYLNMKLRRTVCKYNGGKNFSSFPFVTSIEQGGENRLAIDVAVRLVCGLHEGRWENSRPDTDMALVETHGH